MADVGDGMVQENKSIKIEIELNQAGEFSVKCAMLGDSVLMLGLLEMAKATVFQYKQEQNKVIKPRPSIVNWVKGGKRV